MKRFLAILFVMAIFLVACGEEVPKATHAETTAQTTAAPIDPYIITAY